MMRRFAITAALVLVIAGTGCSSPSRPTAAPPAPPQPSASAPSPASPSIDCAEPVDPQDAEKFEEWRTQCEQETVGEVVLPDPVAFDEKYVFDDGTITEVTDISHPDADTVVLTVKVTNVGNRIPPEIEGDPSANISYAKKDGEKPTTGFDIRYPHGQQDGDFNDSPMAGAVIQPKKSATTKVTFKVPADYQGRVCFNFAVDPDHQWSTFVGTVKNKA